MKDKHISVCYLETLIGLFFGRVSNTLGETPAYVPVGEIHASVCHQGMLSRITFRQDLYLGGYRNTSLIGRRTGMKWGFVGCVRSLTVNNKRLDMRKGTFVGDAIRGVDVGGCHWEILPLLIIFICLFYTDHYSMYLFIAFYLFIFISYYRS